MASNLREVIAQSIETLTHFSIPLYQDNRGRPSLHGSCFVVRSDEQHFLVTAAHVLDTAFDSGLYFYVTPNRIAHLSGKVMRSAAAIQRDADVIDIGVVRLDEAMSPPFPEVDKFSMGASYLQPRRLPRSGKQYVIIGYPSSKSRVSTPNRSVVAAPYAYMSDSIPVEDYEAHGVSPDTHIVLPLDQRVGYDPDGNRVHFPKPQGMSGAPVSILIEDDSESRVFPVVAVGIEYRKRQRVLIATDVMYVIDAIKACLLATR